MLGAWCSRDSRTDKRGAQRKAALYKEWKDVVRIIQDRARDEPDFVLTFRLFRVGRFSARWNIQIS